MKKIKLLLTLLVAALCLPTAAQQMPELPIDPAVRHGKLANGFTYYIRANKLPENRANFYIAQKVGAVQEEDSQRGLAHFLEHMCFNGTKNFPGDGIIKFCERIGVKFGQNLNAYTSTDETVYNINDVPVTPQNVDSCLLILRDWADGLTLAEKEIDKERGVIHEEWRMRSSAFMRMYERNLPNLYPGSRYGHRMPIGIMSVIDNFKYDELRAYYHKWYRPDLQGIVIVGDFDAAEVEAKVKKLFADVKMPENAAKYETYPVPANAEPIYVVDKDKEQEQNIVFMMFKHDPVPQQFRNSPAFLVNNYAMYVMSNVINARLGELAQKSDCPFVAAQVSDGNYLVSKTMSAFSLIVLPKPGQDKAAVQAAMQEVMRASKHGLTDTEVMRARDEFLSHYEKIYNNRDKQKHEFYTQQYVRHFLEGNAIPDIETEYQIMKAVSQQISAQIISQGLRELTASIDSNFVCFGQYTDKEGNAIPTVADLRQAVEAAKAAKLEAYVDNVKSEPLVPQLPQKGQIKKTEAADFGYTCLTLSNGARVFYKVTDFNDSEILFQAQSFGGKSRTNAADHINVELFDDIMGSTGIGNFTAIELQKKLAGKQVSCAPSLGELGEYLNGSATPKDLRTLFELIYLRFQKPANDPDTYNSIIQMYKTQLENIEKLPDAAFSDSLTATLYAHNPLKRRIHLADLDKASYDVIKRIYEERYNAAGDFDFYFTGAINVDSLRTFAEQYIAPLKAAKKRETYTDRKILTAKGVINNHFVRKMETPQANIVQIWKGALPYNLKNEVVVGALGDILTQRYLKSIREEGGMAYSVGAGAQASWGIREDYTLQIYCPVKPALRDSALLLMKQGIEDIAQNGVTEEELNKVKEFELKDYADSQKKNSYWAGLIAAKTQWGKDIRTNKEAIIKALSSNDIKQFVNKYLLKQNNCVTVTMLPADMTENH